MKRNSFSRTHSRTRTNSSSSSASSALTSPVGLPRAASDTPSPSASQLLPNYGPSHVYTPPGPNGRRQSLGGSSTNSSPSMTSSNQYTTSEAAAKAATLKNIANNSHTSSINGSITGLHNDGVHMYHDGNLGLGPPLTSSSSSVLSSPGGISSAARNKISAAAAASAAVFASKPKESALSKAKMFARQATKPHSHSKPLGHSNSSSSSRKKNVDLTIQTSLPPIPGRPSIGERSPLARPSRELERIATIGSLTVLGSERSSVAGGATGSTTTLGVLNNTSNTTLVGPSGNPITSSSGSGEKTIKHHLTFRPRKDSHGLSSSSSNSKLISEQGSIYSFHPSSPGIVELKNMGNTKEERDQVLDGSWSLLRSRVIGLFSGEGLRVPVEDLNNLILMHMSILIQQGGTSRVIMNEFKELLRAGMYSFEINLNKTDDSHILQKLVQLWIFFFNEVLPYLEAIFLPLQCEFQGTGKIISPEDALAFWRDIQAKDALDTRRFVLMSFRDHVIIPVASKLEAALSLDTLDFISSSSLSLSDTAVRILQCTNILSLIQSGNSSQAQIDHLALVVRNSWLSRPRTGKDRRGVVMSRK